MDWKILILGRCKDLAELFIKMESSMKDKYTIIKDKGTEEWFGQMVAIMLEIGRMDKEKVKELNIKLMVKLIQESGDKIN